MTAWNALLAASTLLAGTAWQLITNPKPGGSSGAMTAWDALKAASTLQAGTAWQLITSPKPGGTGGVIIDRYRQISRDVMSLRATGDASNVMLAIGARRARRLKSLG